MGPQAPESSSSSLQKDANLYRKTIERAMAEIITPATQPLSHSARVRKTIAPSCSPFLLHFPLWRSCTRVPSISIIVASWILIISADNHAILQRLLSFFTHRFAEDHVFPFHVFNPLWGTCWNSGTCVIFCGSLSKSKHLFSFWIARFQRFQARHCNGTRVAL